MTVPHTAPHTVRTSEAVPVTSLNFEERLREVLRRFEGAPPATLTKAQLYQSLSELTTNLLYTTGWVPGDVAGFWHIDIIDDGRDQLNIKLLPKILHGKDVMYSTSPNEVTAEVDGMSCTAATLVAAQLGLARALLLREQLSAEPAPADNPPGPFGIRDGETPAERADDKFVLAWTGQAMTMYAAYGESVGWKNFSGGPMMPDWIELPRRIKAAWCFAAEASENYDG